MRDRLIELITNGRSLFIEDDDCEGYEDWSGFISDYLLANGVIVLPCKVGDTVYVVGKFTKQILSFKVSSISYSESDIWLICDNGAVVSVAEQIGKTVFLTREKAEQALQEGK